MALLSKLKSLLGIGGGADDDRRTDTTVTVEHDPDEVVDDEATPTESEGRSAANDAAPNVSAGGAAAESDATTPAAGAAADESDERGVDDAAAESVVDNAESAAETASETTADTATDDDGDYSDEPLDSIKGIGPAYSERLHDAGITSIAELATGDAAEIGEAINVSPKTVSNWIDRANKR